ncbi:MAG: glycosyltransferase family A protein [Nitritalea sp.]
MSTPQPLPLLSVIIPYYNTGSVFEETLNSLRASSYPLIEVIVVDDGSQPDHVDYLRQLQQEKQDFQLLHQPNSGPSVARHTGILHAKGSFILPLDADDCISEDYLQLAVDAFQQNPKLKLVYCQAEKFGAKEGPWNLPDFSLDKLAIENMIFVSAVFKREDYLLTGGFDPKMRQGWEDWEFWINLLKGGGQVLCLEHVGFFYRIQSASRRKRFSKEQKKKTIAYLNAKHKRFFQRHLRGPLRQQRSLSKFINLFLS